MDSALRDDSVSSTCSESGMKIEGALFTGFGGRSSVAVWRGASDCGTLHVFSDRLSLTSWFSPVYEVWRQAIERLIFRERRILPGLPIATLRVLHKVSGAPEYILFITRNAAELKGALRKAGYNVAEPGA
jgi:hypothetical protein